MGFYHYDPSIAAAAIFAALYWLSTIVHTYQLIKWRTWYFIPFHVGAAFEAVGYSARVASVKQKPDFQLGPEIVETLLILVAPALYTASIYMILGRIARIVEGQAYLLVRAKWLTKTFVCCDVVCFLLQILGAAILTSAEDISKTHLGDGIILAGLLLQIISFVCFLAVTAVFHRRICQTPTTRSGIVALPWRSFLNVIYIAGAIILVRCIFRAIEYFQGGDGSIQTHEAYFYGFDALPMVMVAFIFNIFHPCCILSPKEAQNEAPTHLKRLFKWRSQRLGTHNTIEA